MPTYQQHMAALKRATEAGDAEAVAFIRGEATKALQAEEAARLDAEERARPFVQRAFTNLGAGIDSLGQGIRDIAGDIGIGPKVSDAEIRDKAAIDERLASQTTGGGLIQMAGEILPTLAVPVGAGGAAVRGAARVAGRALPQAAARQGLTRAAVSNAAGGAAGGALQATTEDESRLGNMAAGATLGAALPFAMKGVAKAGRATGRAGQQIMAGLPEGVPLQQWAANRVGGRKLEKTLAKAGIEAGDTQRVYTPHALVETKPSAAVASQSERLAALERASRADNPAAWAPFDEANQGARWRAMDENLLKEEDLAARLAKADEIGAAAPYAAAGPKRFNAAMDDFYAKLQQAKATPEYHGNPAVKSAVDFIEGQMRAAGTVTPALMHEIRKTLGKGLTGVPGAGDQGVRAATKDPFVLSLMSGIDDVMNYATKQKWGGWKDEYGTAMSKAERAKADMNVRSHFVDDYGNARTGAISAQNPAPRVTGTQLQKAMEKYGVGKKGPKKGERLLETGSEDVLLGVKRDLDAEDILQRVKRSGTSGGGSDTAMNQRALQALGIGSVDPLSAVAFYLHGSGRAAGDKAFAQQLAKLLQDDPQVMKAVLQKIALREQSRAGVPMLPGAGFALGSMAAN